MITLLQEEIDSLESSMEIDASELMSESLLISDEIQPSMKSTEEHFVTDESVCAENLMGDAVAPTSEFNIGIATTGLKEIITSNELTSVLEKNFMAATVTPTNMVDLQAARTTKLIDKPEFLSDCEPQLFTMITPFQEQLHLPSSDPLFFCFCFRSYDALTAYCAKHKSKNKRTLES